MTKTMKRWTLETIAVGAPLNLTETAVPTPARGEVLVRVKAVSLNYRDKLVRETGMGLPIQFPLVPASDMAGVVEALGDGVTRFSVGDRVISTFHPGWIDDKPLGDARNPPYKTFGGFYPVCSPNISLCRRIGSSRHPRALVTPRQARCPAPA